MNLPALIALAILSASDTTSRWTFGIDLWNGLRSGDSFDNVRRMFPDAKDLTHDGPPYDRERLAAKSQIGGDEVTATFLFDGDRLTDVILGYESLKSGDAAANEAKIQEIVSGFERQYGPGSCKNQGLAGVNYTCEWDVGPLRVNSLYAYVQGGTPLITVSFHADALSDGRAGPRVRDL
jgi:hypothetical protein